MINLARAHLVVLTGYPSSGKTTASKYMVNKLDFTRLSTDDLREEMFGLSYPQMMKLGQKGEDLNRQIYNELTRRKIELLLDGQNTLIDSTANDNKSRIYHFETRLIREIDIKTLKTLLYLQVDRDELTRRNEERGRTRDVNSEWDRMWDEPTQCGLYDIVTMQNNTPEQQQTILRQLEKRFK